MKRTGIVLAGTVVLDIVNIIDHWPEEETLALMERTEYAAGGPPHNAAAGLAKLGAPFPVKMLAAVGDDALSDIFVKSAASSGLDISGLAPKAGEVMSHTHVMSSAATGKRTFFHRPGSNAVLAKEDLLPPDDSARFYYLGSPGISKVMDASDGWRHVLAEAKTRGFHTCLEMVPLEADILRAHVPKLLPLIDTMVVNDHEAEAVTGITLTRNGQLDWVAAKAAALKLLAMGVTTRAAIHHPDGGIAVTRTGEVVARGSVHVRPDEVVSTVGAGDAFYAGVLLGLHEDWPLERCLELGNAAAAVSLQSATTCGSIRPWAECLAYARERGTRPVPSLT